MRSPEGWLLGLLETPSERWLLCLLETTELRLLLLLLVSEGIELVLLLLETLFCKLVLVLLLRHTVARNKLTLAVVVERGLSSERLSGLSRAHLDVVQS